MIEPITSAFAGAAATALANQLIVVAKGFKDKESRNQVIEIAGALLAKNTESELQYRAAKDEIAELKNRIAEFEDWKAIEAQYELKDMGGETWAREYVGDEGPKHLACEVCFNQRQIGLLHKSSEGSGRRFYDCKSCGAKYAFGVKITPAQTTYKTWR